MDILKVIQKYGLEQLGRFYGIHRAVVVNNKDTDHTNCLQVSIPDIFDGITVWAYPAGQNGSIGSGFKNLTPKAGQWVYVMFEYGDPLRAVWMYHGWARGECPEELKDFDTAGFITPSGNKIYLKEVEGVLYIETLEEVKIVTKNCYIEGENITFNQGDVGIPESTSVTDKLNLIEKQMNTLMNAIRTAVPGVSDGGTLLQKNIIAVMGNDLNITQRDDISSKEIKQPK